MKIIPEWVFESEPKLNSRSRVYLTAYLLVLAGFGFWFLYVFQNRFPFSFSFSELVKVLFFSGVILLLWLMSIKTTLVDVSVSGAFILIVLVLSSPFVAFVCYSFGTILYQFSNSRKKINPRAKLVSSLLNSFDLGAALFFVSPKTVLSVNEPIIMFLFFKLLIINTIADTTLVGIYFAILDDENPITVIIRRIRSFRDMIPDYLAMMVFPGLAYMAANLWEYHFYLDSLFLAVPFLLSWRAMDNIPKIVEQMVNTIEMIVLVIEAKDPYTERHCHRVSLYAMTIARFSGLKDFALLERLGLSARLHDVGKVIVPDRALKKDGRLSDEEYEQIKWHTDPNKKLMNQIPDETPLKELIELGRHHHESFDGKGYPDKLKGNEIPIEVRITSMADAWDAMTSNRCYRDGLSHDKALSEIEKFKGKQWDPIVIEAFQDAYGQGAIQEVIGNPDIVKNPRKSWKISPKHLIHEKAEKTKIGTRSMLTKFYAKYQQPMLASILFVVSILLYAVKLSPAHGNQFVLFTGLAIFFELLEMKFTKFPRFTPVDALYLAALFILPMKEVFALILLAFCARSLIERKIRYSKSVELAYRLVLFPLSIQFFKVGGLFKNGLLISSSFYDDLSQASYLFGIFGIWAFLYVGFKFVIEHLATMIQTSRWKISWYFLPLKYSLLFECLVVVPFALVLTGSYVLNPKFFPYHVVALVTLLIWTYPLLEYYRRVVEGNAKTLEALANVADERLSIYHFQAEQSSRVATLSREIAFLLGMSDEEIEILNLAARVFCLGKVGVLDKILIKPGWLSNEETKLVQKYVQLSTDIAAKYPFYKEAVPIIRSQHECWNGGGYPEQLKGKEIPRGSRILAVADAYYAMISERPYRKTLSHQEAIAQIELNQGTQFDPEVVEAFLKVISKSDSTSKPVSERTAVFSQA